MADRESDIYEAFQKCRQRGMDFIIRASQPRALIGSGGSVFEAVAATPLKGVFTVDLRTRPEKSARRATVEVRSTTVTLRGTQRPGEKLAPLTVNVVEAHEVGAPKGIDPIQWILLTSWPVETYEQALRVVKAYAQRWLIEEYHKALKTGAKMEHTQLSTARRIEALLGVLSVVAVRLLQAKLLARFKPQETVCSDAVGSETIAVLEARFGKPPGGWTHQNFLVSIARLGGFLARKGDGSPGWITIWRGWQELVPMAQGFSLALEMQRNG